MSYELKAKGNERFKEGDYEGAEELYSQAIQKNSNDPTFFNNRALVRIKLGLWDGAEHDSRIAVDLYGPKNAAAVKSNYYLSQALLALQRPAEALEIALAAYKTSLETKNPNSEPLSRIILRAKQSIWAAKETARIRERNETLKQVEALMEAELRSEMAALHDAFEKGEMGKVGYDEDKKVLEEEYEKKLKNVRDAFASLDPELQERHMPEHLIDNITFEVMHDPVVTPSGHSFERTSILKHLQQSEVDPITRVPMTTSDLRPNYALKAACEDFLGKNGWAVDWVEKRLKKKKERKKEKSANGVGAALFCKVRASTAMAPLSRPLDLKATVFPDAPTSAIPAPHDAMRVITEYFHKVLALGPLSFPVIRERNIYKCKSEAPLLARQNNRQKKVKNRRREEEKRRLIEERPLIFERIALLPSQQRISNTRVHARKKGEKGLNIAMSDTDFKAAAEASRRLLAKPSNDELLKLYALYKQGTQDPPFEKAPSPGMFDMKGKAKYNAWKAVAESGVTPEEAKVEYIALVETLKAKYGYDETKEPEAVGAQ